MRHGEDEVCALAVLEMEEVLTHDRFAAGLLPQLNGVQRGQQKLLRADAVHLVAHDGDDLVDGALAERQVAVDTSAELTDVSGAEKDLVAGDLGVCGGFAEGGNEELRPTLHICSIVAERGVRRDGCRKSRSLRCVFAIALRRLLSR